MSNTIHLTDLDTGEITLQDYYPEFDKYWLQITSQGGRDVAAEMSSVQLRKDLLKGFPDSEEAQVLLSKLDVYHTNLFSRFSMNKHF